MLILIAYTKQPLFFERNKVYRVYTGGKLLEQFLGGNGEDDNYPEEWIASTVHAASNVDAGPKDGLSIIENTEITLKELGEAYPYETFGPEGYLNVLVKYLDSSIRLPIQAHPDKEFSRKYFNSEYGKTEMWYILATRENANICFGFNDKMTKEQFAQLESRSRTEKNIMDDYLNRVNVEPGEVYLIPAKAVHAIGAGCLILEVQEPTDFTISPEFWCGEHMLSDAEMYLGLSKEDALDCFDYSIYGADCIKISKKNPVLIEETAELRIENLISKKDTPCFSVKRSYIKKKQILSEAPGIYVITKGEGVICGETYKRKITKGDYFFLPYDAKNKFTVAVESNSEIEMITCIPPVSDKKFRT